MNFTGSQLQAIAHKDANLQIIACAGSGKTEVVARRVANLLKTGLKSGLAPRNIVAFTFTDKAAAELKDRILTRCGEELGNIPGLAEMFVGTIHSFSLDHLLTEVPKFLKYDVLNEVQQSLFVDRHSRKSGLTTSTDLDGEPLRRYTDTHNYISALTILREDEINRAKLSQCSVVHPRQIEMLQLTAQHALKPLRRFDQLVAHPVRPLRFDLLRQVTAGFQIAPHDASLGEDSVGKRRNNA